MNPPPLTVRKPKRFGIYIALLFLLCALNIFGIFNTAESTSPVIRELTPLRMVAFGVASMCFGLAGILFIKKSRMGRPLVILGLFVHFAYMLHFNIKNLMQDGPPVSLAIGGMVFGMAIFLVIFSVFGAIPFTRKFSDQLKQKEDANKPCVATGDNVPS
jgi:peptidoglycan/LPS O-acetylase OafA/YrhL